VVFSGWLSFGDISAVRLQDIAGKDDLFRQYNKVHANEHL
jgi:hypothetical protein